MATASMITQDHRMIMVPSVMITNPGQDGGLQ